MKGYEMAETAIKVNDFGGNATLKVTVKITKRFAFRLWLAIRLIRLAARISHMEMDYNELGDTNGKSSDDN